MALPCLPEEKLLIYLTVSIRSMVPPAVTIARLPSSVSRFEMLDYGLEYGPWLSHFSNSHFSAGEFIHLW